jgi:FkbM family methyltransferase
MVFNLFLPFLKAYRRVVIWFLGSDERVIKVKGGLRMKINPQIETDQTFYFGNYERALMHFISEFVKEGDVCLDIGSHKGYFAIQMSRLAGPAGQVHAFDPDPNAFAILSENCKLNDLRNVKLNNIALADKRGTCEFFLNNYLGHSSRFPNKYAAPNVASKITVETVTLDEYLAQAGGSSKGRVAFAKIDAEGSEQLIVSGMKSTIEGEKPVIHMEINYLSLKQAGTDREFFNSFFTKNNYRVYWINYYRDKFLQLRYTYKELKDVFDVENEDMIDIVAVNPQSKYWERFVALQK